jgi:2-polyprenyl-6-methoxyphenol hydroxylase-like FAD-dependent oxidoreductase
MIVPPTGGSGGNVALRDAALLLKHLVVIANAQDIPTSLAKEIPKYESNILGFSAKVVSMSKRYATMITADGWIMPYLMRFFMRLGNFFIGAKAET